MAPQESVDVIVVGGGLAGVTAARDLTHRGQRTVLLEARDRLGGRTASQRLAGRDVDTGGAYFHWFQSAIWTEVQRYELPVVERPIAADYLVPTAAGTGLAVMGGEELDARLRHALPAFWGDPAYATDVARPFAVQDPAMAVHDGRSVEDRLAELLIDPLDERLLRALFTDFGRPLDQLSLAWVLQRMANAVWTHEAFDALFAVYRLRDGMRGLIEAMVQDAGVDVRLGAPVVRVEHGDDGGTIHLADGSAMRARAIVVATPVNVWKSIAFAPALPPLFAAASTEGVTASALANVVMHVRGVPETVGMLAPFGEQPFEFLFTYEQLDDGQLLAGYSMAGNIHAAGPRDALAAALRQVLPGAELVDAVGHDWGTDPYALGGSGSLGVGQLTRFVDVLDRPQGRLLFASGDLSPHFPGFLTGAVESGTRAAQRATRLLAR
jgi:monoamine oxidase